MNRQINHIKLGVFSITLFLSAALMFGLQPMIGKMLLPLVGGTPSSWIVAMAFFQIMLLAGYFLAHRLAKFKPLYHGVLYLISLAIGCLFLPIILKSHGGLISSTPRAGDVFLLLTVAVMIPFIAISATSSTIQRLFTITGHKSAKDPYFLYAASNFGSFTGLLIYPFFIEPKLTLTSQSNMWFTGYIILMGLTILCLFLSKGKNTKEKTSNKETIIKPKAEPLKWKRKFEWIILSLVPSALLLAVTTNITTDIFSAPLLWVIPLSLYLLTFIIAFSKKSFISYSLILKMQPIAVAVTLILTMVITKTFALSFYALVIHLIAFTIITLMCHMRLASKRPLDSDEYLTNFYLMISIGGAIGGIFSAFIAPAIFNTIAEYPIILIVSILLNENIKSRIGKIHLYAFGGAFILIMLLAFLQDHNINDVLIINSLIIAIVALMAAHPKTSLVSSLMFFLGISFFLSTQNPVLTTRNFYGVIKVYDRPQLLGNGDKVITRYMSHGTTLHGMQIIGKKYEKVPLSYYVKKGPLGNVMDFVNPEKAAIIGLGTGTLNCYAKPDKKFTFFEIDPDVIKMAKDNFTFLSKCGNGMPKIITGDARLELKKLKKEKFDLIVLDAFSSDTIPTHLLTKEAMELYLKHLNKNGKILFHISNRYFSLDTTIAATAALLGLKSFSLKKIVNTQVYKSASEWLIVVNKKADLTPLIKKGWKAVKLKKEIKPWTDEYTNLLNALNFKKVYALTFDKIE